MTWLKKGRYTLRLTRSWIRKLTWKNSILIGLTFLIAINVAYIIISLPTLVGVDITDDSKYTGINSFIDRTLNKFSPFKPTASKSSNNLVLDTPTCKIGLGNLWPPEFVNNWNWSSNQNRVPNCDGEKKLFYYIKPDKIIKVTYENFKDCNVREIIRKPDAPNNNYFSEVNQINLTTSRFVRVGHMEMFMVVCNGFFNFEAHLLSKPQVEQKIAFWRNNTKQKDKAKATTERPINILWLGIDTTSRIHLHRSFPKTLKVLNEMNFIEFNGYHSIDFMTQPNFLAFLMGTPRLGNYQNECNSTFEKTWDNCPFIWKEFAKRNYVTMFLEDHIGTLNYNGPDGGFKQSPTDYYLQSLFFAQEYYQRKDNWLKADCMSTETVPQYLLRYNKRFLQKFNSTPFFTFTWFNFPFHEYDFALPNVDADFQKFFQTLQSDPQILENTLIILNSDHGQRYGTYLRNSMEGFLERSLPPLFIRIPEKLIEHYPNLRLKLKEFAELNRNRLTTAFDLHHTLLHVLSLSDGLTNLSKFPAKIQNHDNAKTDYSEFQPVLGDRSSLFTAIPDNRTCKIVHIDDNMCVCNTHRSTRHITNPFEISRMIHHAIKLINSVIIGTEFETLCKVWEGSMFPLYSADVMHVSNNSTTTVLLKFETEPVAEFEIQLRIVIGNMSENSFNTIEKVTEPVRISSYGNTTWCITGKTNKEKYIKEFCYCKEEDATVGRAMTDVETATHRMT